MQASSLELFPLFASECPVRCCGVHPALDALACGGDAEAVFFRTPIVTPALSADDSAGEGVGESGGPGRSIPAR